MNNLPTHLNLMLMKPIDSHSLPDAPAFTASFCPIPDVEGEFFCLSHIFGQAGTPFPVVMTRDQVIDNLGMLDSMGLLEIPMDEVATTLDTHNSLGIDVFADERPCRIIGIPQPILSRFTAAWVANDLSAMGSTIGDEAEAMLRSLEEGQ